MANIKSQIKRNRQNEVARVRNQAVKSRTRTVVKRLESAIEDGDRDAAEAAYVDASAALDRAVTKGVLHRNAAARRKSRLHKRVAAL